MALGDIYTDSEVDSAIDTVLPVVNAGRPDRPLDRATVRAMFMTENMGDSGRYTFANRRSPAGATGVSQVMPSTIASLKQQGLLDSRVPEDLSNSSLPVQVLAGIASMAESSDRRKTTDPSTLAAEYVGGPKAADALASGALNNPDVKSYLTKFGSAMKMQKPDYIPPSGITAPGLAVATGNSPIAAAQGAFTDFMTAMPGVMSALGIQQSAINTAGPVIATGIRAAGDAAAESARQAAEVSISEDITHGQIMSALGLDVRDPDSAIRQELQRKADAQQSMRPLRSQITNFQSVSFLENPLQFIMNIPAWQQTAAQFNQFADTSDQADENIRELQAVGNSAKSLTPARAADSIRAKAAADAAGVLSQASITLGQAQIQNAAGIAKANLDELTIKHQIFQGQLQLESADIQKRVGLAGLADREELLREKMVKNLGDENIAKMITQYRTMLNGKVPETTVADLGRMTGQQRAAWEEVIQRGNFGNTYEDSIPFISTYGNKGAAAGSGNALMMQQVSKIENAATALIPKIQDDYKRKNPLGGTLKPNDALKLAYAQLYGNDASIGVAGNDKGNIATTPYALDYDAALSTATAKKVTGNAVIDSLAYWKSLNPNKRILGSTTDNQIIDQIASNVSAGKIEPKIAAQQISEFYKTMSHDTYMAGGLAYIGLPELKDYNITPSFAGNRRIDLMNPTQVENYLQSRVAGSKSFFKTDNESLINSSPLGLFN